MSRTKRPHVTVRSAAECNREDQRLIEASHPGSFYRGAGCLISIEATVDGRLRIEVWRADRTQEGHPLITVVCAGDMLSPNSIPPCEHCGFTNRPACALEMGCLCAGHARGNAVGAPCDTREAP